MTTVGTPYALLDTKFLGDYLDGYEEMTRIRLKLAANVSDSSPWNGFFIPSETRTSGLKSLPSLTKMYYLEKSMPAKTKVKLTY